MDDSSVHDGEAGEGVSEGGSQAHGASHRKWWFSGGGVLAAVIIVIIVLLVANGPATIKVSPSGNGTGGTTSNPGGKGTGRVKTTVPKGHPNSFNPNLPVPAGDHAISITQAQSLLSGFQSTGQGASYVASYTESGGSSPTSFTVAQSPPRTLLSLVDSAQAGSGLKMEVINTGSGTYNCFVRTTPGPLPTGSNLSTQVAAGKGVCMSVPPSSSTSSLTSSALTGKFSGVFATVIQHMKALVAKDPKITGLVDESSRTVLGMTLQCLDAPVTGMSFCWTPQGALGYVNISPVTSGQYGSLHLVISNKQGKSTKPSGPVSITLTSYTTSVPANEFTLPGPIIAAPSSSTGSPSVG